MDDVDPATFLEQVYAILATAAAAITMTAPRHPGPPVVMRDDQVLVLLLLARFCGKTERGILRWARFAPAFVDQPLLTQSAFNRRVHRLGPVLATLLSWLAAQATVAEDAYEVVDGLPLPLAHRCRGERARRFTTEEAAVGRGGPGKAWYYGDSVVLSVGASGPITGVVVAPANVGERWSLSALLTWRVDPTAVPHAEAALATRGARTDRYVGPTGHLLGPTTAGHTVAHTYLADQGFRGKQWQAYWREELGATVITADQVPQADRHWFHDARQTIETVNGQLVEALHLRQRVPHTPNGVIIRVLATCVTFNLALLMNHRLARGPFAVGTLCNR